MRTLDVQAPDFWEELNQFAREANRLPNVTETVSSVLQEVAAEGDAALKRYSRQFDGWDVDAMPMRVTADELEEAWAQMESADRERMRSAMACVQTFHEQSLPKNWQAKNPHGAQVGERFYPLQRVGIYVPGGRVPLVSTVFMTCVLARTAGVEEIVVCTPANAEGRINPAILAALRMCGVNEVYRLGGAQAIAAMAYGTETVSPVNKVAGPGNAYVTEAQRQVFGRVGVALLPGPSEAFVLADETANPAWAAADFLAQAEHAPDTKIYMAVPDAAFEQSVKSAIESQLPELRHANVIRQVLEKGALIVRYSSLSEAAAVADFLAPEHLELHVQPAHVDFLLQHIRTAGAILVGHETPTVLGDFTAGPSHTLPTSLTGRFFSGLQVTDFMRRSSYVQYDRDSLVKARETVRMFAELEQLDAHGRSMEVRFDPGA